MRVLVTGATGFIGSHLVGCLLSEGAEVYALLRPASDALRLRSFLPQLEVLHGDLRDSNSVRKAISRCRPDLVFHLGATGVNPKLGTAEAVVHTNVLGTLYLLEAVRHHGVRRFVYAGSCFEYGDGSGLREAGMLAPTGVYAASKAAGWLLAETYFRSYGIPVVSVRPFTAFGPSERSDRLVPNTIIHALKRQDFPTTLGEQERDFVYVEDMVRGFLAAATSTNAVGRTFNLCSGSGTSVREMIEMILSLMGNPITAQFGAVPYRDGEIWRNSGDTTQAQTTLGWEAKTSLECGLQKTIAWFEDNLELALHLWR